MGRPIGALWTKHSEKGLEYYSGNVQFPFDVKAGSKVKIVVFANDKKKDESWPDYNILLNTPRQEGAGKEAGA